PHALFFARCFERIAIGLFQRDRITSCADLDLLYFLELSLRKWELSSSDARLASHSGEPRLCGHDFGLSWREHRGPCRHLESHADVLVSTHLSSTLFPSNP